MRHVFLDTCIWRSLGFARRNPRIALLEELVRGNDAKVLTCVVQQHEMRRRLCEMTAKIRAGLHEAHGSQVEGLCDLGLEGESTPDQRIDQAIDSHLAELAERLDWEVISIDCVPASRVFALHATLSPPFSNQKKCEFGDAFMLEALQLWALEKDTEVSVLTDDPEMQQAIRRYDRLILQESIEQIQEAVLLERASRRKMDAAKAFLADTHDAMEEEVGTKFDESSLHVIVEGVEASLLETIVGRVHLGEFYVVEDGEEELEAVGTATISVELTVQYAAEGDYFYLREDGSYYVRDYTIRTIGADITVDVSATLYWDETEEEVVSHFLHAWTPNRTLYVDPEGERTHFY